MGTPSIGWAAELGWVPFSISDEAGDAGFEVGGLTEKEIVAGCGAPTE
jgi:hypothetical protein